jgi:hypothetical protein
MNNEVFNEYSFGVGADGSMNKGYELPNFEDFP